MRRLASIIALLSAFFISTTVLAEWDHSSELGVVIATGNTESRTENAKHESKVNWAEKNTFKAFGSYIHTFTEVDATETDFEIWDFGGRYDRKVSKKVSLFFGNSWEGNRDAGYSYRTNIDLGAKYDFYKDSKHDYFNTEAGYRFTYEEKTPGSSPASERKHIARVFFGYGKEFREGVHFKWWVEFLPDLSETENIEINTEPSLSVALTDLLSLKVAYLIKYDNVPATDGNERLDSLYTTTLVANY